VFVGQATTVSYTFSVQAPGAGSPIPPSGNITVTASDGSSCMAAAAQGAGMCTLSLVPTAAGNVTYAIAYAGDGNFVPSGANGNYNVYQLVFTTQPSNTGAGLAITPAVQVAAEDSSGTINTNFTGGVTLAIGSGTGTLSGTTTQSANGGVASFNNLSIDQIADGYTLKAGPGGGVFDATSNAFDVDTFYVDNQGNFGTLDLASGSVHRISAATVQGSTGIDLTLTPTPTLQLYTYNTSNQLLQINPSDGTTGSPIGSPGPNLTATGALTDGSYYGIDAVSGNLYSIATGTGITSSPIPTNAATPLPAGCIFETSLTGSAGSPSVLYYTVGYTGGTGCTAIADMLYKIDPTNGNTTQIGPIRIGNTPANGFVGSAFVGGKLYGFTVNGAEYVINPTTGGATSKVDLAPAIAIVGAGSQ
jgi:hypothetical protein